MQKGTGRGWFRRKEGKLIFCWYNFEGRERSRVLGPATMPEADGWKMVARLSLDTEVGHPDPVNATFDQVMKSWLDAGKSKTGEEKAHSSLKGDLSRAKVHLVFWENRIAKDIQPQEIQKWLDGKAIGIRCKLRNQMSAVFRYGQATGLIPRGAEFNPMGLVSAPTRSDFESIDLSPAECTAILEKINQPMIRVLVVVVAVTGLRAGEVVGLKWMDLDFRKGRIHVRRSWSAAEMGRAKSKASQRPVPMATGLAELLQAWRKETKYASDDDFVFPSDKRDGKQPRTAGILVTDYIHPAAIAAGVLELRDGVRYYDGEPVRRFGLHAMRHGLGSWLADRGVDLNVIQRMLRHSSPTMTMHYIHSDARKAQEEFVKELVHSPKSFIFNGSEQKKHHCGSTLREHDSRRGEITPAR